MATSRIHGRLLVSAGLLAMSAGACGTTGLIAAPSGPAIAVHTAAGVSPSAGAGSRAGSTAGAPATHGDEPPALSGWHVGRRVEIPGGGQGIVADGSIWIVDAKDRGETDGVVNGDIYRIDPTTMRVTGRVAHARGGFPVAGEGAIWLINAEYGQVATRVDPDGMTASRLRTSQSEDPVPEAIAIAGGSVWVGNNHDGTVARIDPRSLEVVDVIGLTGPGEFGVRGEAATDGTSLWFGISRTGEVVRIDAASGREASRFRLPIVPHDKYPEGLSPEVSSPPESMVVAGDRLWVSTLNHVYVVDVSRVGAERIVGDVPVAGLAAAELRADGAGGVWALEADPMVLRHYGGRSDDPDGVLPLDLGSPAGWPIVGDGAVYVRVPGGVVEVAKD